MRLVNCGTPEKEAMTKPKSRAKEVKAWAVKHIECGILEFSIDTCKKATKKYLCHKTKLIRVSIKEIK